MTAKGLKTFDRSSATMKEWLKVIKDKLTLAYQEQAFEITKAVLHILRDRLTVKEATDFAAQLPMLLQGLYYNEWTPMDKPEKMRGKEEFFGIATERLMGKHPAGRSNKRRI